MARPAAATFVLIFLVSAEAAAAQRPSPISGDEAGPAPAASAPAASAVAAPAVVPERPGCTLGAFHGVGDSWFTSGREGCLKYTCQRSGVVSSQPCPRVLAPEGCTVKDGPADALYPACCPRRECVPAAAVPLPAVVVADVPTTAAAPASSTAAPSTTTTTSTSPSTTSSSSTSSEAPTSA